MKTFTYALVLILISSFIASCSGTKIVKQTRKSISIPTLNTTCSSELGETLIDKGFVTSAPSIEVPNDVNFRAMTIPPLNYTLGAGSYAALRENSTYTFFYPTAETSVYNAPMDLDVGYRMRKSDGSLDGFRSMGPNFYGVNPVGEIPAVKYGSVQALNKPSFRQQLIYNGKSGDNLKFLYREFSNSYARAPFSQEIQYDLKESSIIGFKGARIDVIEATNRQIKYRVLANFPAEY